MRSNLQSPPHRAAKEWPRAAAERGTRLAFLLAASFALEGCSLIGLGIGAATPRYQELPRRAAANADELPKGEVVEITAVTGLGQEQIDGSVEGVRDGKLLVDSGYGTRTIPLDHVMTVRVREGSYWAAGLAAGAVIDAVVLPCVVVGLSRLGPTFPAWDLSPASAR